MGEQGFKDGYATGEVLKKMERNVNTFEGNVKSFLNKEYENDIEVCLFLGMETYRTSRELQQRLKNKYGEGILNQLGISDRINGSLEKLSDAHKELCYLDIEASKVVIA